MSTAPRRLRGVDGRREGLRRDKLLPLTAITYGCRSMRRRFMRDSAEDLREKVGQHDRLAPVGWIRRPLVQAIVGTVETVERRVRKPLGVVSNQRRQLRPKADCSL